MVEIRPGPQKQNGDKEKEKEDISIVKLVNDLIAKAVDTRASDIHIEPFSDECRLRYRIDGVLNEVAPIAKEHQSAVISRVKVMAKLNIAEKRLPQDGRIRMYVGGREIDIRVSTIPIMHGESLVMRLLDNENVIINLDILGFQKETHKTFNGLIKKPNGIILVTGPTGSGKTTTLYGSLDKINSPDKKIITVEDPVEYLMKGINQMQVKPQIGLTFSNTLRHVVRQDPDVVLIGEIRDLETAEIAIQAALTGHLVFSTLHTNDAPSALTRLIDMGVQSYLLSSTVRGILAQRLVRVICPHCKTIEGVVGETEHVTVKGLEKGSTLYYGKGCEKCAGTGYRGRTGIFELLVVDDDLRKLVLKSSDANELRKQAMKNGMKALMDDGIDKVRSGITTLSEVLRVTVED